MQIVEEGEAPASLWLLSGGEHLPVDSSPAERWPG